ncbi:Site-specific recombinase XerD [Duganella sacchari]|uniref:Site-specific recombinase XerD n=1 Tax=Duganella sacchari TaxID=551987 RepID=A0A1M7R9L6_9BURK|nr:tyrosine-type recombinase/integrase [Duganella sacchari]SHN43017.1 Site-specific recombinase XerD [Duganella sacchari]
MKNNHQLFRVINDVELPSHLNPHTKTITKDIKTLLAFLWPDGSPCVPIELFLLEKSYEVTVRSYDGGSLKVWASHLSHLARYCFNNSIQFQDLDDNSFKNFAIYHLGNQEISKFGFPSRSNNTNRAVIRSCISFLQWLQTTLFIDRVIVGSRELSPQIRLIKKEKRGRGLEKKTILEYPYAPSPDTPEPKGPMPGTIRNKLWDIALESRNHTFRECYLQARREQILSLLEATGCRPGELAMMAIDENPQPVKMGAVFLRTEKRRRKIDPLRRIPVSLEVCITLERYLMVERADLIAELKFDGHTPNDRYVFLTADKGLPISPSAMNKDFTRMVKRAGITQRACMSMFRHRFITIQVALHLQDYLASHNVTTTNQILILDKISILTRVAAITGHSNPESLLPYIDLAWEYLGAFRPIDGARELVSLLNESAGYIRTLGKAAGKTAHMTKTAIVESTVNELRALERRIRKLIDPPKCGPDTST